MNDSSPHNFTQRIKEYLTGQLADGDMDLFEKEIQTDKELRKQVEAYQQFLDEPLSDGDEQRISSLLNDYNRRESTKAIVKAEAMNGQEGRILSFRNIMILSSIAAMILVLILVFPPAPEGPVLVSRNDTIQSSFDIEQAREMASTLLSDPITHPCEESIEKLGGIEKIAPATKEPLLQDCEAWLMWKRGLLYISQDSIKAGSEMLGDLYLRFPEFPHMEKVETLLSQLPVNGQ